MGVITGQFALPNGSPVANGTWQLKLSQDAVGFSGTATGSGALLFGPSPIVVPPSATPVFSASGIQFVVSFINTLTANVTAPTLAGVQAGAVVIFDLIQDGTGLHTFAWPGNVLGGMGVSPSPSSNNIQAFYFDGTNARALAPGATT
jgi:hypothetical protein